MATIKQIDDQISKLNQEKYKLVLRKNQLDAKLANLHKSLAAASNNPKAADVINKQIDVIDNQRRAITGIDFEVNEEVEVMEEDGEGGGAGGESISSDSYAGAAFQMPLGWNTNKMMPSMNPKASKKKKDSKEAAPLTFRRDNIFKMNTYIDNLGGN